jgi:hypothetical protein
VLAPGAVAMSATPSTLQAPQEVVRVFIDAGLKGDALAAWWTAPNPRLAGDRPCDRRRLRHRLLLARVARADAPELQRMTARPVGALAVDHIEPRGQEEDDRRGTQEAIC